MRGSRSEYNRLVDVGLALFGLPLTVFLVIGNPLVRYAFPNLRWLLLPIAKIVLSVGAVLAIVVLHRGLKTLDLTRFQRGFVLGLIILFIFFSTGFWLIGDDVNPSSPHRLRTENNISGARVESRRWI